MAEPKYREIADDLRRQITSAEPQLPPGSRLPTEIELMEQYSASRNTVRDAIKLLTTRGLVETRPGQGTFVPERIEPFETPLTTGDPSRGDDTRDDRAAEESGRSVSLSPVRVEVQQANQAIAKALGIAEDAAVVSRHQQRSIDRTPWSLQTTFYPMALMERGATRLLQATDIPEGVVAYLAEECGVKQAGYRETISVRPPDENETAFFRLPADGRIPVFVTDRVGFDQDGRPFRLTVTVYPTDRNRFVVEVGEVPRRREQPAG